MGRIVPYDEVRRSREATPSSTREPSENETASRCPGAVTYSWTGTAGACTCHAARPAITSTSATAMRRTHGDANHRRRDTGTGRAGTIFRRPVAWDRVGSPPDRWAA